jgi:hypothetical protein
MESSLKAEEAKTVDRFPEGRERNLTLSENRY